MHKRLILSSALALGLLATPMSIAAAEPGMVRIDTDEEITLALSAKEKKGEVFAGWDMNSDGIVDVKADEQVTISKPTTFKAVYFGSYALDVNVRVDGVRKGSTAGIATFDVVMNGKVVKSNATDYYKKWAYGTEYEITNIQTAPGYRFVGLSNRKSYGGCIPREELSGTIIDGGVNEIVLMFEEVEEEGQVVVKEVREDESNLVLWTGTLGTDWWPDNDGMAIKAYNILYKDKDGNIAIPEEAQTVVINNVELDEYEEKHATLVYAYIDPTVTNGNQNGVRYWKEIPYEYDSANHRITFTFDGFDKYTGYVTVAQGGHRQLTVDDPHGDLTWSVNNNCEWGEALVDQNGVVEAWGSFDNVEVTATDGNKSWVFLVNVCGNDIRNTHLTVNVGETFYCYGDDDMRAGWYLSSELREDGRVDYEHESGAIRDNGDGTATALRPGEYNLVIGFKYYREQEGYSMQFGRITILEDGETTNELESEPAPELELSDTYNAE